MNRYAYGARFERNGIATYSIAYQRNVDTLEYAVARCNPKDRFVKKEGRKKADLRLAEGCAKVVTIDTVNAIFGSSRKDFYEFTHSELNTVIFSHILHLEANAGKMGDAYIMTLSERQEILNDECR